LSATLRASALSGSESYTPFFGVTIRHFQSSTTTETQLPVRSIAAASRAAGGGPPRPAPRCAKRGVAATNAKTIAITVRLKPDTTLINRFAGTRPPRESIERPTQTEHQCAVLPRHTRRTRGDRDLVADLQRLTLDALRAELCSARPLNRPALDLAMLVGRFHVHERVRIAQHELHELPFELDLLG